MKRQFSQPKVITGEDRSQKCFRKPSGLAQLPACNQRTPQPTTSLNIPSQGSTSRIPPRPFLSTITANTRFISPSLLSLLNRPPSPPTCPNTIRNGPALAVALRHKKTLIPLGGVLPRSTISSNSVRFSSNSSVRHSSSGSLLISTDFLGISNGTIDKVLLDRSRVRRTSNNLDRGVIARHRISGHNRGGSSYGIGTTIFLDRDLALQAYHNILRKRIHSLNSRSSEKSRKKVYRGVCGPTRDSKERAHSRIRPGRKFSHLFKTSPY